METMHWYCAATPRVTCYDGEGAGSGAADKGGAEGKPGEGTPDVNPFKDGKTTLTQDEFNHALAEDRRRHKAVLEKSEATYKALLADTSKLSEAQKKSLEESLSAVQGQLRTKEQQAEMEKRQLEEQYTGKLTEAEKKAQEWEGRYRQSTIARALQDAAITNEAFASEQIVTLLQNSTKLVPEADETGKLTGDYKVVVELPSADKDGKIVMLTLSPDAAVKHMKDKPEKWGNLFKSGVSAGIGGHSGHGSFTGSPQIKDVKNMSMEDYMAARAKAHEDKTKIGAR